MWTDVLTMRPQFTMPKKDKGSSKAGASLPSKSPLDQAVRLFSQTVAQRSEEEEREAGIGMGVTQSMEMQKAAAENRDQVQQHRAQARTMEREARIQAGTMA